MNSYAINFFVSFHDFSLISSLVQRLALPLGYGIFFSLGKKGLFLCGNHVRELVLDRARNNMPTRIEKCYLLTLFFPFESACFF